MQVSDYLEKLSSIQTEKEFTDALQNIFMNYGGDTCTFFNMSFMNEDKTQYLASPVLNYWFSSNSLEWCERYTEKMYVHTDPVFKHALQARTIFAWDDSFGEKKEEIEMMKDALDHGYGLGLTVPMHGPQGDYSLFSLYSSSLNKKDFTDIFEARKHEIEILAHHANDILHQKFLKQELQDLPEFAGRELECLEWSSRGKTAWEVGEILGISERTVRFHLKNIREKLNVSSTSQAIAVYNAKGGYDKGERL